MHSHAERGNEKYPQTITAFSIMTMLAGAVNAMPTEQSQQLNPTQIPPKGQTNSTPRVNQTTEQFDLPLLVKTGTAFFQSDRSSSNR